MLTHNHRHHHSHMAPSLPPLFFTFLITLPQFVSAYEHSNNDSPPPTPIPTQQHYYSTFKPGIAIIIAVLTLFFSLTFILLLYIKHCTGDTTTTTTTTTGGGGGILFSSSSSRDFPPSTRKNSGINRSVVESLPIFRFGSLTGHKDGLDCAVCLNKFDAVDVLRLLPKCKHAFHVECVDTWLDAHSTCPLCRYRVDPEDILLVVEDTNPNKRSFSQSDIEKGKVAVVTVADSKRRRHSSVGEKEWEPSKTASFRWSLDSRKKNDVVGIGIGIGIGKGCFVRPPRKDGMLLTKEKDERISVERRLEHRIIVSPAVSGVHRDQRWSDVQPCDLLYLTSEMIISEARGRRKQKNSNNDERWKGSGGIINSRSVSEITGLSRFPSNSGNKNNCCTEREEGLVSRWLAWISHSHSQTAVR